MSETLTKLSQKIDNLSKPQKITFIVSATLSTLSIILTGAFYIKIKQHKSSTKPLNYKKTDLTKIKKFTDTPKNPCKLKLIPNKTQIPKNIDYIIIGSGISGLTTATILAKCGYKVLCLEQNGKIGGCLHVFNRKYKFDTGLHYIGKGDKYKRYLKPLLSENVEFYKQGNEENGFVYDQYCFGDDNNSDLVFNAKAGKLYDELLKKFPNNKNNVELCKQLSKQAYGLFILIMAIKMAPYNFVKKIFYYIGKFMYKKLWNKNVSDIMDEICGKNSLLNMTLCGNLGDLGGFKKNNAFIIMSMITNHYKNGGYYFSPSKLVASMIGTIEKYGGRCVGAAPVSEIIFTKNKATGVKVITKNGTECIFNCKKGVISSTGFYNTYNKLANIDNNLPTNMKNKKIIKKGFNLLKSSPQHMQIFIGFDKNSKELNLPSYNKWVFNFNNNDYKNNEFDYDKLVNQWYNDPLNGPVSGFLAFPSAKDPNYSDKISNCTIVSEVPYKHFKEWETHSKPDTKPVEYKELKKKIGDRLINELLLKYHPNVKDSIVYTKYGTGLTSKWYLGSYFGESYGLSHNLDRYFDYDMIKLLSPKPFNDIDGFWMTGQDNITAGFGGAFQSGKITAEAILGYHTMSCLLSRRDVLKDLAKMDQANKP